MRIVPVPCLRDNYAYLVICEQTNTAAVVDPSEAGPVLEAVKAAGTQLVAVWNTHHHWDHVGGNEQLASAIDDLAVVAHESDRGRVPGQTREVAEGDVVALGDEVRATIIFNPGHTAGAISYHLVAHESVFTGDTLFAGGCGRIFEGTPPQMHASLTKLAALPPDTNVYCGHEYTVANLTFAKAVEPDNLAVSTRLQVVEKLRAAGKPSVPSTIADERATNPFLRAAEATVVESVKANEPPPDDTPAEVFAAVRRWKNRF